MRDPFPNYITTTVNLIRPLAEKVLGEYLHELELERSFSKLSVRRVIRQTVGIEA